MEVTRIEAASAAGTFVPQTKNAFILQVDTQGANKMKNLRDPIILGLFSFPFPKQEAQLGETNILNETRKWAKAPVKFDGGALVLNDYVDQQTATALQQWNYAWFNPKTGKWGNPADYKCQGTLILFGPNQDDGGVREWTLYGLWCRAFLLGEGTRADGAQNQITGTLEWDYIVQTKPAIAG